MGGHHKATAIALAGLSCLLVAGCAVGQSANGRMVVGVAVDDAGRVQTPVDHLEDAAGFLPAPWGSLALAGAGLLGGGMYGRERGRHTGWDEATTTRTPPAAP